MDDLIGPPRKQQEFDRNNTDIVKTRLYRNHLGTRREYLLLKFDPFTCTSEVFCSPAFEELKENAALEKMAYACYVRYDFKHRADMLVQDRSDSSLDTLPAESLEVIAHLLLCTLVKNRKGVVPFSKATREDVIRFYPWYPENCPYKSPRTLSPAQIRSIINAACKGAHVNQLNEVRRVIQRSEQERMFGTLQRQLDAAQAFQHAIWREKGEAVYEPMVITVCV